MGISELNKSSWDRAVEKFQSDLRAAQAAFESCNRARQGAETELTTLRSQIDGAGTMEMYDMETCQNRTYKLLEVKP